MEVNTNPTTGGLIASDLASEVVRLREQRDRLVGALEVIRHAALRADTILDRKRLAEFCDNRIAYGRAEQPAPADTRDPVHTPKDEAHPHHDSGVAP